MPSKYKAVRTKVNGLEFASQKEARRYSDLLILERAGRIRDLELQPRFPMRINDQLVCTYVADFKYFNFDSMQFVVEDVKSEYTRKLPLYRIKYKLMKAIYGITIEEV
jgi:hypothetical protein